MSASLEEYLNSHASLSHDSLLLQDGTRVYSIKLPAFQAGREIISAQLRIPNGFPNSATAEIWLDRSCVLRIPHIEANGKLCTTAEPGPMNGDTAFDRLDNLLFNFSEFCELWNSGSLDHEFIEEANNYWLIHCLQSQHQLDPVDKVLVLDQQADGPRIGDGVLIPSIRTVIFGKNENAIRRAIDVIGKNKTQIRVIALELPISQPLIPDTWPTKTQDIYRIIKSRLGNYNFYRFWHARGRRNKPIHKILIMRSPTCSFGFLLPHGPVTPVLRGNSWKSRTLQTPLPLPVERLDVSWTCGRDQHPEVISRQNSRVLVIGAGALGSAVIPHLVKAGVGHLILIDPDRLSTANLGRHTLGADSLGKKKAHALTSKLLAEWPSVEITSYPHSLESWLQKHNLKDISLVVDLTGEPNVRMAIERARISCPCKLVVGWMEPFVAAAHACMLPSGVRWSNKETDPLNATYAIEWPTDMLLKEPGCSSQFQSYTDAAAMFASALIVEAVLTLLDKRQPTAKIRSLIRGRRFLDEIRHSHLNYHCWAKYAEHSEVTITERDWNE